MDENDRNTAKRLQHGGNQGAATQEWGKLITDHKTLPLCNEVTVILSESHPLSVRQIYTQLIARKIVPNDDSQYQTVDHILLTARQAGVIPWEWIAEIPLSA